jgi:hypothetical protein
VDYVRIHVDGQGRSHFEDVHPETTEQNIAEGVPPLVVTGPFPATAVTFVEQKPAVRSGNRMWRPALSGHLPARPWGDHRI